MSFAFCSWPWSLSSILGAVIVPIAARRLGVPPTSAQITENPRVVLPIQTAAYLVVLVFMVATLRVRQLPFWKSIRWNWPGLRWTAYLVAGVLLGFLIESASAFLPIPKEVPFDKYFTDATGAYLMAVFGITLAPLMEELLFRGFLYPSLNRWLGLALSLVITSLAFALLHAAQLAHRVGSPVHDLYRRTSAHVHARTAPNPWPVVSCCTPDTTALCSYLCGLPPTTSSISKK